MTPRGNPRCRACGGQGVKPTVSGMCVCHCVRGTAASRKAHSLFNSINSRNPSGDAVRKAVQERDNANKQRESDH